MAHGRTRVLLRYDHSNGLELLRRCLRAGLAVSQHEGTLRISGHRHRITPRLLEELQNRKSAVITALCAGERLLNSLWAAGFHVRLAPSESRPEGVFLLPVGNPPLTQEHLEALFEAYEHDHGAALLTLLARLPKAPRGRPDWQKWNEMADKWLRHVECLQREAAARVANRQSAA